MTKPEAEDQMSEPKGLLMKYFVLKPHGHDEYAYASRQAMLEYSRAIGDKNRALADDLIKWVADETPPQSDGR